MRQKEALLLIIVIVLGAFFFVKPKPIPFILTGYAAQNCECPFKRGEFRHVAVMDGIQLPDNTWYPNPFGLDPYSNEYPPLARDFVYIRHASSCIPLYSNEDECFTYKCLVIYNADGVEKVREYRCGWPRITEF